MYVCSGQCMAVANFTESRRSDNSSVRRQWRESRFGDMTPSSSSAVEGVPHMWPRDPHSPMWNIARSHLRARHPAGASMMQGDGPLRVRRYIFRNGV